MDAMVANAINGKAGMPPKGGCADCSDDDIKASVQYMVDAAK
jgi:cytochrome c5